ncbi:MarR family transcriptional regulator [Streptosporangium sp. NPDC051022]|uniref:helix-turn-helix domain-containing protein n=1 Tax=Streptosporangium sp. NPDC051022 TaxID=3155752 RepID=UPI0034175861
MRSQRGTAPGDAGAPEAPVPAPPQSSARPPALIVIRPPAPDSAPMHRLGKHLIELSAAATGEAGDLVLTPGETAVLEDAIKHPDGSVTDIQRRTGFAQSHVSASVSRLRERGLVETVADPGDGRRTRVRVTEHALRAITRRGGRRVDDVIDRAVADPSQARRVTVLLDEPAALLL